MGFLFISYSRQDLKVVDFIVSQLKDDGFDVWIDRENIKAGELWREQIVRAIKTADAFVLILSPNSVKSDNVRKEVDLAETSKRSLFPLLLASVDLPDRLMYQLSGIQWIEFHLNPENKYRELVEVLRAHQRTVSAMPKTRQAEVVLGSKTMGEFGEQEQEAMIKLLARKSKTPPASLRFANVTAGSVHAFIDMPADAAYILTTAALNRDRDLIKHGIDAMRLDGEENYVLLKTGAIGPLDRKPPRSFLPRLLLMLIGAGVLLMGLLATALALAPVFYPPTSTPTASPTITQTITATNTATATMTSTFTPTASPSPTITVTSSLTPFRIPRSGTLTPFPNLVDLHLWWHDGAGDNYVTTNFDLSNVQPCGDVAFFDYSEVRIEGRIFSPQASQPPGTIPLYSWYSCDRDDGIINTIWPGEVGDVRPPDYMFLRLEGYIYSSFVAGTVPLYNWWSPSRGDNFASTFWTGNIGDIRSPDYTLYRVEGYVFPP